MSLTFVYIIVTVAVLVIFVYNKVIDTKSIISSTRPWVKKLMEKDYEFLLRVKYKGAQDLDVNALFQKRIRNGII